MVFQKWSLICQLMVIWCLPIGVMLIPVFDIYGTISQYKGLCKVMEVDGSFLEDFLFVGGIMIPCVIVIVLYACIYRKVRRQTKAVSKFVSNNLAAQLKDRNLTVMTLLIFITFVVCCIPSVIEHFWFADSLSPWPNVIGCTFCGLLCIINPFIYAATNLKYRAAYSKFFSKMKCC